MFPKYLRVEVAPDMWASLPVVRALLLADGKTYEVLVDASRTCSTWRWS